jgi:hypothetical protein
MPLLMGGTQYVPNASACTALSYTPSAQVSYPYPSRAACSPAAPVIP